ncbi:class GN sortase [Halioglobus maricola]|uniref:Class GN sortase n=1 Tax=Halioglobus maricola TaxID=2601894 RepID=A0A5P9NHR3_9GAMM|nr:class GN sortase [Halioglobus maricola]QFU75360.1 class GN sortase [Halioglobus maricola]
MPDVLLRAVWPLLLLVALQQLGGAAVINFKAWLAPVLLERAFVQSQAQGGAAVRPWPWADTWPVARLRVPAMAVSRMVLAGDSGNALAFGPGHSAASAPLGGPGEVVLGGHRDTHFRFLERVEPGTELEVMLGDGRMLHYRVTSMEVVNAREEPLRVGEQADRLLLVTCFPFDSLESDGPLRYVVSAERSGRVHL